MIFKKWEKAENIPFPSEIITYTDADILEQRKRVIKCDENRFKRICLAGDQKN